MRSEKTCTMSAHSWPRPSPGSGFPGRRGGADPRQFQRGAGCDSTSLGDRPHVFSGFRGADRMRRFVVAGLLIAVLGCSDDEGGAAGENCTTSDDCGGGLVCLCAMDPIPGTCSKTCGDD